MIHELLDAYVPGESCADFLVSLPDILLITGCFTPCFFLFPCRHIDGFAGHISLDLPEELFREDLLRGSISHGLALLSERIVRQPRRKRNTVFGWKCF